VSNLTVEIDAQDLSLGRFQQLAQSLSGLIREVGDQVAEKHRDPVRWVVSDVRKGSVVLELTPQRSRDDVPPDLPDRIADVIATGMALIEQRAERPPFFSDKALERAKDLASPVGDEVRAVRIRRERTGKPTERVTVTKRLAANVEEIIGGQVESFGTVEGRRAQVDLLPLRRVWVVGAGADSGGEGDAVPLARSSCRSREPAMPVVRRAGTLRSVTGRVALRTCTGLESLNPRTAVRAGRFRAFTTSIPSVCQRSCSDLGVKW